MVHILYIHEMSAQKIYEAMAVDIYVKFSFLVCFAAGNPKFIQPQATSKISPHAAGNCGNAFPSAACYAVSCYTLPLAELMEFHFARAEM